MNSERLKQLLAYLKEEPEDPFNHYAVAMELIGNEPSKALQYLANTIKQYPDYLPAYYQAAALYADAGQLTEAQQTYEQGIALARQQNNANTLRELQSAYNQFLFENEDELN